MLAEYPNMADAHPVLQGRLVGAWFRRKRLEARLIANEVGRLFGGQPQYLPDDQVDQDRALAALGLQVKYFDVRLDDATTG